jgi:hypothetical protein
MFCTGIEPSNSADKKCVLNGLHWLSTQEMKLLLNLPLVICVSICFFLVSPIGAGV